MVSAVENHFRDSTKMVGKDPLRLGKTTGDNGAFLFAAISPLRQLLRVGWMTSRRAVGDDKISLEENKLEQVKRFKKGLLQGMFV